METGKRRILLGALVLIVLAVRLFFAFRTPALTEDTSYFNLRQIEHIREAGFPIYNDELSYSGRFYIFLPLFHYVMAFFSLIIPLDIAVKLIPNLLITLIIPISYLVAKELTKSEESSLVAALLSGFLPILFYTTVNTLSASSLVLPLSFLILLTLMRIEKSNANIFLFIALVILMSFADQSVIILLFGFFVYLFLAWLEKLKLHRMDLELISFSTLFVILLSLILFKNVFFAYGPDVIRQNIPSQLLEQYFSKFNLLEALYKIGIIPLIFGIYFIYRYLFVEKDRNLYILISFALSLAILIILGMIELNLGLVYFSIILSILSAGAYKSLSEYVKKTKFASRSKLFMAVFLALFAVTSIVPSMIYANLAVSEAFTPSQIAAFEWIKENTPPYSVVVASVNEGHLITAIADRKNIIDTNFILQEDSEQILTELDTIYTTKFQTDAVRLLNKYGVKYIVFSNMAETDYGIDELSYVNSGDCFRLVYDNGVKIYESRCVVTEE